MVAGWRQKLQPASFRGVPFFVDGDDLEAGRRTQVHEYPQRDTPFVEDLGRATRKISVTAFLVGPDYMARRDALLQAVESGATGTLVHPQYGSLSVAVDGTCSFSHSREEGGLCRVRLCFVEAGEAAFPAVRIDTVAEALKRAEALDRIAGLDFLKKFGISGFPDFIGDAAVADLMHGLSILEDALFMRNAEPLVLLQSKLGILTGDPRKLVAAIQGIFRSLGSDKKKVQPLTAVAAFRPAPQAEPGTTPLRKQEGQNRAAVASLIRRAALAQASRSAALSQWSVRDDALVARDTLVKAYRAEEDITGHGDVFAALGAARLATAQDIGQRVKPLPRLERITVPGPVPALVLAYDRYEDIAQEADIITRNNIAHPGFVPGSSLLVAG
ncbi:hypothetical protein HEQ63_07905 [Haematospirillum jordaniae]|uniref:DNA circularization protein n=1 Tax=Haematospirillum jordaniae TaxID=1549855 RepID=UPI0014328B68|nr:DNA circularization N-terminal domain-containing protein [Haematospirillum jordaniae]NKD86106.1 hypothetical protein [Haematospirillum jordaniae]